MSFLHLHLHNSTMNGNASAGRSCCRGRCVELSIYRTGAERLNVSQQMSRDFQHKTVASAITGYTGSPVPRVFFFFFASLSRIHTRLSDYFREHGEAMFDLCATSRLIQSPASAPPLHLGLTLNCGSIKHTRTGGELRGGCW